MSQQRVLKVVVILYALVRMAVNLYFSKLVLLRLPLHFALPENWSQQRWRGFGPADALWQPWFLCSSWPQAKEASALCVEFAGRLLTQEDCKVTVDYTILAGCFAMPLVPALGAYILLSKSDRFAEDSRLHVWCRRNIFFLAAMFCLDPGFTAPVELHTISYYIFLTCEVLSNGMQAICTNMKLRCLSWDRTARCCEVLMVIFVCMASVILVLYNTVLAGLPEYFTYSVICFLTLLPICGAIFGFQFWAFCRTIYAAKTQYRDNWEDVRSTVLLLGINALLTLIGPLISGVVIACVAMELFSRNTNITQLAGSELLVAFEFGLQIFNSLVLCGMIGPWSRPTEVFTELATRGFVVAKRVPFKGKINPEARGCIASFPGKYAERWAEAVAEATQSTDCSLACVFLTDAASGLGMHARNPETDECWCRALYGDVPAEAYLSIVDKQDKDFVFRRADSEAMGQHLLIKDSSLSQLEWDTKKEAAMRLVEKMSRDNSRRAPWGCQWFEEWMKNIEAASGQNQQLHVFYFENFVGRGKVSWSQLSNEDAIEAARRSTGLGASQTAEVAYLDKLGLPYVEHDVMDFPEVIAGLRSSEVFQSV